MAWKELKLEEWLVELEDGLEFRRRYGIEDKWSDFEGLFYNVDKSSDIPGPNIIQAHGDALLSNLTVPNPYITLESAHVGMSDKVKILERIDNNLIYDIGMQEEIEDALIHAYIWGVGFLKVGYDSEFGWDQQLASLVDINKETAFSQFDKKGRRIEFNSLIRPGMPWVTSVLPHDMIFPYGTRSINRTSWATHRVVRHIEDVKADPKYSNTRDLRPVMSMEDFVNSYRTTRKLYRLGETVGYSMAKNARVDKDYVELFEIHDTRTGRLIVIASGHTKFLRNDVDALQFEGQVPFVDMAYTPRARSIWTTPDAKYMYSDQCELSDIALQSQKQRRLSVLKFLFLKGAIQENDLETLLSADVGPAVGIEQGAAPSLRDAVIPWTPVNNNVMLQNDAEYIRRNSRERLGISRNQAGEYEGGRKTATEVREVGQAADTRFSRRMLKGPARAYEKVIRILNECIFEFWTYPRWIELDGEVVSYTGRDLRGEYRYKAKFSSEPYPSRQARIGEALQLYSMLSQDPLINQIELRKALSNAYNDVKLDKIFEVNQNAGLPIQMPGMPGVGGGMVSPNAGGAGASGMPPM